jgi:glyoxylase-like metal-dependent hydrolase (beta-lactamase superfamily II)
MFLYRVGAYEVYVMVETRGPGRDGILIGADEALKSQYLGGGFESETNAFLIKGGGKVYMVDTGFGGIFMGMDKLKIKPADVNAVFLTHMHGDHIGGMAKAGKALFPNAIIYVAEEEKKYWTETNVNKNAVEALAPYEGRILTFKPEELGDKMAEIVPGLTAIASYGHTPGHTCFLLQSRREKLLIWGDLMHVQNIQFPRPDISVTYDTDPLQAAETRKKFLAWAASGKVPIAGMHLVFPAVGSVGADGKGGYKWSPVEIAQ